MAAVLLSTSINHLKGKQDRQLVEGNIRCIHCTLECRTDLFWISYWSDSFQQTSLTKSLYPSANAEATQLASGCKQGFPYSKVQVGNTRGCSQFSSTVCTFSIHWPQNLSRFIFFQQENFDNLCSQCTYHCIYQYFISLFNFPAIDWVKLNFSEQGQTI